MNQCKTCGANLIAGAKFCTSCGTPVVDATPAPAAANASNEVPTFHAQAAPTVPVFGHTAPVANPAPAAASNFSGQPVPNVSEAAPAFGGQPVPPVSNPAPAAPNFSGQPVPNAAPNFAGQPVPNAIPNAAPNFDGQPVPNAAPNMNGQPMVNGYQQPYVKPANKKIGAGAIAAIIGGVALFLVIIGILVSQVFFKSDYKDPIEKFEKGINNHDVSMILDAFPLTETQSSVVSLFSSSLEDEFANIMNVDIKITSATRMTTSELQSASEYNQFQSFTGQTYQLSDGYKVYARMSGFANGDSLDKDVEFTVCKWNGKWYIFDFDD